MASKIKQKINATDKNPMIYNEPAAIVVVTVPKIGYATK
jgi:hypothetical protein